VIDSYLLLTSSGNNILPGAILSGPCLSGVPLDLPIRSERIGPSLRSNPSDKHRSGNQTNGDSRFGQNPIPKTGGQGYLVIIRECVRLPVEGRRERRQRCERSRSIDWMTAAISVITPGIPLGPYWNCECMNEGTTTRTCCGWHGDSSRWIRRTPNMSSSTWVKAGRHISRG